MGRVLTGLLLGFIAGALAFVTAHELLSQCLLDNGYATRAPWPREISPLTGLPQIVTDAGIGGLWGALFSLLLGNPPHGSMTLRGIVLGLLGPALLGALVVPPLMANEPLFFGNDINLIWPVLALGAVFGAVTAWLYGFFTSGCRLP